MTAKICTLGTDSAHNMVAAARSLSFQHMPCVAHAIQRVIVMAFRDGTTGNPWPKGGDTSPGCTHTLEFERILHNKEPLKATLSQQKHSFGTIHHRAPWWEKYVSCSIVLPALCHLQRTMEVSDVDPAYVVRFKTAFTKDLDKRKQNLNLAWLKVATALDPRPERGEVWQTVSKMLRKVQMLLNLRGA
ncbi:hypothetical protein WMY93_000160 [Mugilogobius chulae]|uniref:Uncharacterized protein n=1 Tax=Mugilogobius chulae TaxID=88201 RepID=A0AAW0Q1F6_9GOBI